jgi:sorbitol-specific phosphotransferase system component IIBC
VVGPVSDEERSDAAFKIKVGIVAFVAVSAGLITLQGDGPLWMSGLAVLAGALTGLLLVYIVFPGDGSVRSNRDRR